MIPLLSANANAGAVLTIDLDALRSNYRALCSLAGGIECSAVVKADAYGLGIERVVPALWQAGCRTFFVALLDEAVRVLAVVPHARVYVLNGLFVDNAVHFLESGASPVLSSLEEIREWQTTCRSSGKRCPSALHVDTGINRMGISEAEFAVWADNQRQGTDISVTLVMSHLACAEERNHPMNEIQLEKFGEVQRRMIDTPASLANSAGSLLDPRYHFDMLRPGIALYGGNSLLPCSIHLKPVVHLAGRIMQVRDVPSGGGVGYGATWVARRDSRIAVVGAGYADGYFRAATGNRSGPAAYCSIDGTNVQVVGRISMDMITVDVTDIDPDRAARGKFVELLGDNVLIDDFAQFSGTIGYEVLTNLGSRYARVYSGA